MSTAIELAGFACLVSGAWMLSTVAGMFALGVALLFVGYSLDGITVRPAVVALQKRWSTWRGTKTDKSASN